MADTDAVDDWPDIGLDGDSSPEFQWEQEESPVSESTVQPPEPQEVLPELETESHTEAAAVSEPAKELEVVNEPAKPEISETLQELDKLNESRPTCEIEHIRDVETPKEVEQTNGEVTSIEKDIPANVKISKEIQFPHDLEESIELNEPIQQELLVPQSNGHRAAEPQDTVADLQVQLSHLRLQIEQKDHELESLKNNTLETKLESAVDNSVSEAQIKQLEDKLEVAEKERDDAKEQLEGFLSKISSMKTMFRNYKATQEELEEVKEQMAQIVNEKEEQVAELATLREQATSKDVEIRKLTETISLFKTESSDLNSECDRLSQQLTLLRREYQIKDDTFQDEKYTLENEVSRLTKKVNEQKTAYNELELAKEEVSMENKNLALIIEELKGKVEAKDAEFDQYTKIVEGMTSKSESVVQELRAEIESKNAELETLAGLLDKAQHQSKKLAEVNEQNKEEIAKLQEENTKIAELKEEVHSKQLIIGKLRHEAIILNEHLTKSLSMLKQQLNKADNTVDRELISNVFLNFLQIPRGDSKKFEALLLISALLEWDDTRKVQAGLSHNFSRSREDDGRPMRLSFVSLWTDFLEKESSSKATK